jgi:hypothetical protein
MLTQEDKLQILNKFPNIKLSYEKYIHNKVYNYDLLLAIPEGQKCFAWFTIYKNKSVCIMLETKQGKEITNINIVNACFDRSLCYGTLVYGTLFYHKNSPFFSMEDIHSYKGNYISNCDFNYKLTKMIDILKKDIKQMAPDNSFIIFGLPIIAKSNEEMYNRLKTVSYKLHSIQTHIFNKYKTYFVILMEEFTSSKDLEKRKDRSIPERRAPEKVFICKPDIQNDIYHLYSLENEYIGLAGIPDYKTSIMMNKLFRKIKENDDLDALEDSDDEEEFENENIDKFVYLDKSYKFICVFNHKFRKWVPVRSDLENKNS